jgi:hypothetical protein
VNTMMIYCSCMKISMFVTLTARPARNCPNSSNRNNYRCSRIDSSEASIQPPNAAEPWLSDSACSSISGFENGLPP